MELWVIIEAGDLNSGPKLKQAEEDQRFPL